MRVDLIIDEKDGLRRAALATQDKGGKRLIDLAVDRLDEPRLYQSIWAVRIDRVVPHLGSFAALGAERSGLFRDEHLTSGDTVIAQVKSLRPEAKADLLTSDVALAGKSFVYLPQNDELRVTRQAGRPEDFDDLLDALEDRGITGGIVRTAALTLPPETILDEAEALRQRWLAIEAKAGTPGLLEEGPDAAERLESDYGNWEIARQDSTFEERGLEEDFETLLTPEIDLPRGGSIIIERTAALTAIDVNSGARPAAEVNREAVEVIARQIRLRNLAGLMVIDFIAERDGKQELVDMLQRATAGDPAGCRIAGITPAGLIEMTRRRRDLSLAEKLRGHKILTIK